MRTIFQELADAAAANTAAALCVVVNAKGSTPAKEGAKMIVYSDGSISGTIGGGRLEKKVIAQALEAIASREPRTYRHDLLHQHNMCCGGSMDIYIEPVKGKNRLYIFGAGHVGSAIAHHAALLDFETVVIDDRKEYIDNIQGEHVNKMNLPHQAALQVLPMDKRTFIVIATYDHAMDREILAHCIKKPHAYVGMIASRRKTEVTKKMFIEGGLATEEELAAADIPIGFNIGAQGPEEIAISIIAKLIEVKNKL